ncbi:hypothetical protein HCA69_10050 [Listeria grandensis]|uniref:Polymerase nucleotidyl transferase domain-containing protein n=1 Tax=Listeria grandensis TaxID=1494963 RepID=A0A7X0Y511_9LIST|nr:hypothetical protein [Listeria grandensis]MBC1936709.1 hypothetical protein [Listeria grandensis]
MTILDKYNEILASPQNIIQELWGDKNIFGEPIIYLAGSLAEGFGNDNSDIDIYCLINPEQWNQLVERKENDSRGLKIWEKNHLIHNIYVDGYRMDIEFWNIDYVNNIVCNLNKFDFNADQYTTRFSKEDLDFLHRIKFGKCISNKKLFDKLYMGINFSNLGFYQVITGSEYFGSYLEDIEGAMESEDFGTTYIIGKILLDISISNFLFSVQETNPSAKWLYRKLQRYEDNIQDYSISEVYWSYQKFDRSKDNILKFVNALIESCTSINNKAQENLVKHQRGNEHVGQ